MARGVDKRRLREASSDAFLWDDLDQHDNSFAHIITPPLQQDLELALQPSLHPTRQQNTASNPIIIPESTAQSSMQQNGLELELFPTHRPQDPPSSSTSRSQRPQPPSSFDFEVAAASEPWSQNDLKATQFLRDEWLISAGQKQPNDLVEDYIPHQDAREPKHIYSPPRTTTNVSNMASSLTSAWAARAQSGASSKTSTAKRGRSSLLDQLDMICSSPSPHSSSPSTNEHASIQQSPATGRQALRPITSITANTKATTAQKEIDERAALGMLNMSCSPPSQEVPHIMLISDMPPERQEIYRRLALGGSSSSAPTNVGATVRGTRGKTWQTTWQNDQDEVEVSESTIGRTNNTNGASSNSTGISAHRGAASTSSRGRKTSVTATGTRKGARTTKTKSSSTTTASRGRSRFFASRARGGWRGRGRGR
ncbi:uncharacterized protein UTRI_03394 [Ustilago trichophora]|uniref:Uncharacterized protein n=1 Tax=Ustilago trichophora TaxID=86804 RepID=A0A5C3E3L2_9BASI|nr:uncharacterized protein UTRI_03394 [Ustilago trichophora]